jgi:hypothetical protein
MNLILLPSTPEDIAAVKARCKSMVTKRALASAGASMIPMPGLDVATDAALLLQLIPEINRAFGLTPEQIEQLNPNKRVIVYKAIVAFGGVMIGRVITKELVAQALKVIGLRLTAKQATKLVPIAGQACSAVLGFGAMRYIGVQHIEDCVQVAQQVIREEKEAAKGYPKAERIF